MRRALAAAACSLALAGCAHAPQAEPEPKPNENLPSFYPNQPLFDVAVCTPPPPPIASATLNEGSLLALLLEQRARVLECLVPLEHRELSARTQVRIETTVGTAGVAHAVSGDSLSDEGRRCVEDMLAQHVPLRARAVGATPVHAVAEFSQAVTVVQSLFEPLDYQTALSGQLRRALPTWCECYAGYLGGPVAPLDGTLEARNAASGKKVWLRFSPEPPAALEPLAACLTRRAMALPFHKVSKTRLPPFPLRLRHLNTAVLEAPAVLQPELHFHQLEGERNARAAEAARAWGRRLEAAQAYSARVAAYEASKDPERIGDLQWRCAVVVQASRAWRVTLERQQEADVRLGALLEELSARGTITQEASAVALEARERTAAALSAAERVLQEDEAACPQSHEEPAESAGK